MAKGRMLNKKISLDDKVNQLSCDTARLLFTWMIAHLDQNGCFYADPNIVKNLVFPRREDLKVKRIAQFLDEFEASGLIQRYKLDGETYLSFPHFEQNQPGLRKEREAKSDIPLPLFDGVNPTICRNNDGNTPIEENRSITEVEGGMGEISVQPSESQQQLLNELHELPQWGNSQPAEDLRWLIEFKQEFPAFWIPHIRGCRDYHSRKLKHSKALWKSRLRNWMSHEKSIKDNKDDPALASSRVAWETKL